MESMTPFPQSLLEVNTMLLYFTVSIPLGYVKYQLDLTSLESANQLVMDLKAVTPAMDRETFIICIPPEKYILTSKTKVQIVVYGHAGEPVAN